MEKIDFLSAGESENTAITFTCIFLGKIFLESLSSNSFQSINLRCIDANQAHTITRDSLLYKCGWSPFEGTTLRGAVTHTFLNGALMYENGNIKESNHAKPLSFTR